MQIFLCNIPAAPLENFLFPLILSDNGVFMKKILMSFYIIILAVVFYQLLLGKNGLIEGYRLTKELNALDIYINYLKNENTRLREEVNSLKRNPANREELANKMGYFSQPVEIYRIIKDPKEPVLNISQSDHYLMAFVEANIEKEDIDKIKIYIHIAFYMIISIFILLIVFGGQKE